MSEPTQETNRADDANSSVIADLGILYQLTGNATYAEYGKNMLVELARNYPNYPHPRGWIKNKYRSALDGRISYQFLNDGFILARLAVGYDFVYNLSSWTPEERKLVHDGLLDAICEEFYDPVLNNGGYISTPDNRSCVCNSALLMSGYATDDPKLINMGLYGVGGTKDAPVGGVFGMHFSEQCILPDGMWVEGSPSYGLGIACCGLFNDAQTLWHHGYDMYSYRNGIVKHFLDSAINLAYPTDQLTITAIHDAGRFDLLDKRDWLNNEVSVPFECGYQRYHDPQYVPIINNAAQSLGMTIHSGPISLFPDIPADAKAPPRAVESDNYFAVGLGVLRNVTDHGPDQALLEYGPQAGHGHPSKLGLDLYALGAPLIPFPGVIFPYNDPLDPKWFWVSFGNCELTVDRTNQIYSGNFYHFGRQVAHPNTYQEVFGPARTIGMQRAWSNEIVPVVTEDRAIFLTPHYLADTFSVFSATPHTYDMVYHFLGTGQTDLNLTPHTFPAPECNGYNALSNVRTASTDGPYTATIVNRVNKTVHFVAGPSPKTQVFTADGPHWGRDPGSKDPTKTDPANDQFVLFQRRDGVNNAIFANAVDISGRADGYVKSLTHEGDLESGYSLSRIKTVDGTDLCFVSYRPGTYQSQSLSTDAAEALVTRVGDNVVSMYLAGTTLKVDGAAVSRDKPGLAYIEKLADGPVMIGNPCDAAGTLTVELPALAGLHGTITDAAGKSLAAPAPDASGKVTLRLGPNSKATYGP